MVQFYQNLVHNILKRIRSTATFCNHPFLSSPDSSSSSLFCQEDSLPDSPLVAQHTQAQGVILSWAHLLALHPPNQYSPQVWSGGKNREVKIIWPGFSPPSHWGNLDRFFQIPWVSVYQLQNWYVDKIISPSIFNILVSSVVQAQSLKTWNFLWVLFTNSNI